MSIKLENWYLSKASPWKLCGEAIGHPKHPERHFVTTSRVKGKRNGLVVTASGSEYELGTPEIGYEMAYNNARERVLATIPELP